MVVFDLKSVQFCRGTPCSTHKSHARLGLSKNRVGCSGNRARLRRRVNECVRAKVVLTLLLLLSFFFDSKASSSGEKGKGDQEFFKFHRRAFQKSLTAAAGRKNNFLSFWVSAKILHFERAAAERMNTAKENDVGWMSEFGYAYFNWSNEKNFCPFLRRLKPTLIKTTVDCKIRRKKMMNSSEKVWNFA